MCCADARVSCAEEVVRSGCVQFVRGGVVRGPPSLSLLLSSVPIPAELDLPVPAPCLLKAILQFCLGFHRESHFLFVFIHVFYSLL